MERNGNSHADVNGVKRIDLSRQTVSWPRKIDLFGVHVSVTNYEESIAAVMHAAERRQASVVACQAVHAIVTASEDPSLCQKVNTFDLVTPDGQPVRWAMNLLYRTKLVERVYGPELTMRLCREAERRGVSIYLYGGAPDVLNQLQQRLGNQFPRLRIAGAESPPFRELTATENKDVVDRINASGAGLVFLGLGCPKQDHFAYEHRDNINAVLLCVGAAFDFHAGRKKMAPKWMQRRGLEWLFRLCQEPRRLWRRYLVTNSIFLYKLANALFRGNPSSTSMHT